MANRNSRRQNNLNRKALITSGGVPPERQTRERNLQRRLRFQQEAASSNGRSQH